MGKFEEIKNSVPENFDWHTLHPAFKTTILVEAINCLNWSDAGDLAKLDNIEWLVEQGASYSQKCGHSDKAWASTRWKFNKPDVKLKVAFGVHSSASYIEEWIKQVTDKGKEWQVERKFLEETLGRIARASSKRQTRPRSPVDDGIVEIWEKFLHATASHDLTLEAADGQVTAHSGMLQEASPVVQAMLASPMTEGKSQRIQLKDTSRSAVTLFLEALYTCSFQGAPDYQTALSALDLAHRWQVEVVVAILADLLQKMITQESFPAIAEHAALKNLDTLKQACRKFGSECDEIQDKIKKGQFPRVVRDLFQVVEASSSHPVKKRKLL
eukprot:Skav216689  [mRNA]  locus=scaffold91:200456:201436:+ [translate_table: standard]